jgi:leucyl-tRNA synthetase
VWALQDKVVDGDDYSDSLRTAMHKTIKKVSEDIENMKFNTAIAAMMTLLNDIYAVGSITKKELRDFLVILYPFAPHITEEMYQLIGCEGVLDEQEWVSYDEALCVDATVEIVCQINGRIKCKLNIPKDCAKEEMLSLAKSQPEIKDAIEGKNIVKEIAVPNKLVNIVAK